MSCYIPPLCLAIIKSFNDYENLLHSPLMKPVTIIQSINPFRLQENMVSLGYLFRLINKAVESYREVN